MRSPFEVFVTSETIQDETERYEFTLQWTNPDGSEDSRRVLGEENGGEPSNEGESSDEDQDNGNDGDDEGDNNNDGPLEELGRMLGSN